ncbi:MAG TPA: DMT family transporter [candidate division Zixibacteria bacterium]|nr:DMT family transporter [candidate division Zixibacteria bacterium]
MLQRIYLLLAVIFWGGSFVATKILVGYVSPVEVMGLRFIVGLPFMFGVVLIKGVKFNFQRTDIKWFLLASTIITIHFVIQITGIRYTSATNTGWIISITPLILAVLSFFILHERLGVREIAGIIVATGGIFLLISRGDFAHIGWLRSVGDWLVLVSAHTWAIYTVVTRDISRKYNPLAVTFTILVPSAVVLVTYMLFTSDWGSFLRLPTDGIVSLLVLGILSLAAGHWFWQEGIAAIGAAKAGFFLYLEPLTTTVIAVPYLHEKFGVWGASGAFLVLAGVFIAERRRRRTAGKAAV